MEGVMQWPLLSGCRLGTGAIRRLISGHCCHWPVVPSTPRRSLRNTASESDRSTPALPRLASRRSFLVLAVLHTPAQEIYGALLLQALQGTCPRFNHSPMQARYVSHSAVSTGCSGVPPTAAGVFQQSGHLPADPRRRYPEGPLRSAVCSWFKMVCCAATNPTCTALRGWRRGSGLRGRLAWRAAGLGNCCAHLLDPGVTRRSSA